MKPIPTPTPQDHRMINTDALVSKTLAFFPVAYLDIEPLPKDLKDLIIELACYGDCGPDSFGQPCTRGDIEEAYRGRISVS